MPTLSSLKQQLLSQWEATLPPKMLPATQVQKDRMESIATAVLSAGDTTIGACTINGGIILGGASAPGGPVAGALMNTTPGSLTSPVPWVSSSVFIPPTTIVANRPVMYTDWLRVLQTTISDAVQNFWTAWFPTWSCAGVSAIGGVAAWIPPAPPSPGSPGPWTAGTIVPFPLVGVQGINPSPALDLMKQTLVATCKVTPVTVQNGQSSTLIPLVNGDLIQGQIESFCDAFKATFNTWASTALVTDSTGAAAMGTAIIPTGSIVGGTISGLSIL